MPVLRVLPKQARCYHCDEPLLETDDILETAHGEQRHARDCPAWVPRGPVSDGSLRCPVTHDGVPCQRRIPQGWHENEGHGGGHWFEPDAHAAAQAAGQLHVDAAAALALQPFAEHPAPDCPTPGNCPLLHR